MDIEFQSAEEIKAYQENLLHEQLTYLKNNSPYYQRMFKSYDIDIDKIQHIEDLVKIPFTEKKDLQLFNDKYQGIPIGGYNKLIEGLLDGVECKTGTDFFNSEYRDWARFAARLVYTGPLDEYFSYKFGKLDWRTVSFKNRIEDTPNFQGNAVVNYTSHDKPYTRVIEHKHFEMFGQEVYDCPKTVVSEEYSTEYQEGMEPYYPVNDERNNSLAEKYRNLAQQESDVLFGGRLAQYKYFDMAPIVEQVLNLENI